VNTSAIYPGSFDPVTRGHEDLIRRAAGIFTELTVAVAEPTGSKPLLFSMEERVELIRHAVEDLDNVMVEPFEGLLVDYATSRGCTVLVRGVRAFSDFEYEFQMALMNRKMTPEVETVFLMPSEEYSYVSSSLVREVASLGGDIHPFVSPQVAAALQQKLSRAGAV
jgi:pantetheine-phosphate adenylyltransferase